MRAANSNGRLLCLLLLLLAPPGDHARDVAADEPAALTADRLVLSGLDGTPRAFDDLLGDGRAVCFAFLHPVCPLARDYAPVLDGLAREFATAGIQFVGVVCEYDETAEVEAYARKYAIGFPVHLDADFALAEALGATTTPQVVLVDRDRRIRYSGRVDDRSRVRGVMTPGGPEPELSSAIRDLLASYDDAVDWTAIAIEEIESRLMPPAQIESDLDYTWPKPPTPADLAMLRRWVADGKPEGDAADTPPLEPLPDFSAFQEDLGPPDIIPEQPEPTQLGSHGNDVYRNIMFPLNRPEDLRLRAIQFLPGNRRVVHHALTGHLPPETANDAVRQNGGRAGFSHPDDRAGGFWDPHGVGFRVPRIRDDGQPRAAFLSGFVPGVRAAVAPADAAIVIPAGCDVVVQGHYVRTGKLETDSSRIGIWLDGRQPRRAMNMIYVNDDFAVVPQGVTDFRVRGSWTLPADADMVGVVPRCPGRTSAKQAP